MKLLVISPTPSVEAAARMVSTARLVGIEPELYGFTSNHPGGSDYQGTDVVTLLTARTEAEYVMCVDAFDVAFLAGEEEILGKFSRFPHPFVMSAERTGVGGLRKTKDELQKQCNAAGGQFAQPNIGCWIGEREYVLKCYTEADRLYRDNPEDVDYNYYNHYQWLAMMKAWGGGPEFCLDYNAEIFQSMDQAEVTWDLDEKRVRNDATATWPCILHYHGDPTRVAFNLTVNRLLG